MSTMLDGVRVISFGQFIAGNTPPILLAELGADVLKIEARNRPEVLRTPAYAIGPTYTEPSGAPQTVMLDTMSRGTRSLSIDLNQPAARPVFHRLIANAHVVIENFGARVLQRWECTFEQMCEHNPRLVWLSLSGYGRTGPRASYLGYATSMSSYMGLTTTWGWAHGTHSDYVTADTGFMAVLAGLAHAERYGTGVYLDVSQIDATAPLMAATYAEPLNNGNDEPQRPNTRPGSWLVGVFPARHDDSWLAVDLEDGDDWTLLCRFLGLPELDTDDPAVASTRVDDLHAALAAYVAPLTATAAMHALQRAGLAAGVVQDDDDVWRDPQLRARGFPRVLDHPVIGPLTYPGPTQRWTKTPGRLDHAGPLLGEHTEAVLRDWIGATNAELTAWAEAGAIFQA